MALKRNWNIDYLRIFACFMVVFLHVSAQNFYAMEPSSFQWQVFHFYNNAVRSAVPIFFMISGCLFLSKEKMPSLKILFKKNIFKIVFLYFLWTLFYALDFAFINESAGLDFIKTVYKYFINPKYHLWYMPALVSVYLLLPILWTIAKYDDGKYLKYACIMFLLFGVLKKTVLILPLHNLIEYLINRFTYNLSSYSGYFLLGYYLYKNINKIKSIKTYKLILSLAAVIVVSWYTGLKYALYINEPSTLIYNNLMLPSCLEGILLFSLFLKLPSLEMSPFWQNIILKISKYTLLVYLFHVFVMQHLSLDFGINTLTYNPLISVPTISLFIFIVCLIFAFIVVCIPIIRKLIM